jgi:hypothetical protein
MFLLQSIDVFGDFNSVVEGVKDALSAGLSLETRASRFVSVG